MRGIEIEAMRQGSPSHFSAADSLDVSPKTIRELASLLPVMTEQSRIRRVIAPSHKVFRLARMFELHGEPTRVNSCLAVKLGLDTELS